MARNSLTAAQDVLVREFLVDVALAENVFSNHTASKKRLIGACYELLNYQRLSDGRFISKDKKINVQFGNHVPSFEEYPDEWDDDYQRALNALDTSGKDYNVYTTYDDQNTDEADSSESSTGSKIRKAVLSEDV